MLRQYDFEHEPCGHVQTELVEVPDVQCRTCHGARRNRDGADCPGCSGSGRHQDSPARYYDFTCKGCGEHGACKRLISAPAQYTYDKAYMPIAYGGKWDTQGFRRPPRLPALPNDASFDQARDMFNTASYKEMAKEKWDIQQQNEAKKARAKANAKGANLDLRNCPLPGDPPKERVAPKRRRVQTNT